MPDHAPDNQAALHLLRHPIRPLAGIVEFILRTGDFPDVDAVLDELPDPVETGTAVYERPREWLEPYAAEIARFVGADARDLPVVLDEDGRPLDATAAASALLAQRILELELERINSLLCGARHCVLCCTGPDSAMRQDFFYIPLQRGEESVFATLPHCGDSGRNLDDVDAACGAEAALTTHRDGRCLLLPRLARCPALDASGRCAVYPERPQVCRRPQIFPYLLEPEGEGFRLRKALLAVVDCPYVRDFQDDIARYAAASELEPVFRRNKA